MEREFVYLFIHDLEAQILQNFAEFSYISDLSSRNIFF